VAARAVDLNPARGPSPGADAGTDIDADPDRRFGGLKRLYGAAGYARLRAASVAVVGVGGVGSWAVEALARCGVARLVLVDFDQVAESNVNRQVQALSATLGQAKVQALRERIASIHPGCEVHAVEAFVEAGGGLPGQGNWPALLPCAVDAVVDACDEVRAKLELAHWARTSGVPLVAVGAAGGKRLAQAVEASDLAEVSHDPLLAALRQRWRQAARKAGAPLPPGPLGLACVHSREPVQGDVANAAAGLACAGYGSTVAVTATFGFVAAGWVVERIVQPSSPVRPDAA
jgi:tRNA A37 threonylcarbamoyladenosine dehydratase